MTTHTEVDRETLDGGYRVEIHYDEDGGYHCNPRDMDNLSVFVFAPHRNYTMPNEIDFPFGDEDQDWSEDNPTGRKEDEGLGTWARRVMTEQYDALYITNVFMLDHSGVSYSVSDFADPWDSGQIGWAIVTKKSQAMCGTSPEDFAEVVKAEVDEYSSWANGECYGWVAIAPDGEQIESCWGYLGFEQWDEMKSEGRYACAWHKEDQEQRAADIAADAMVAAAQGR